MCSKNQLDLAGNPAFYKLDCCQNVGKQNDEVVELKGNKTMWQN